MHIDKLEKLIQTLQTYPEFYKQATWGERGTLYTGRKYGPNSGNSCGTRGCKAAYTVMMEGYSLYFEANDYYTSICHKGKKQYNIRTLAAKILGLDERCASILFDGKAGGWRHEKEFRKAHKSRKVDVAIMELQDLIALGPYPEKREKVAKRRPSLQEANAEIVRMAVATSDAKAQEPETVTVQEPVPVEPEPVPVEPVQEPVPVEK